MKQLGPIRSEYLALSSDYRKRPVAMYHTHCSPHSFSLFGINELRPLVIGFPWAIAPLSANAVLF